MTRFAANLSMMFTEHDFLDRFAAAAKAGFKEVEFLFPYDYEAKDIATRLKDNGLTQVLFNMPPGDWDAGERGFACLPNREDEFHAGVERAINYASILGVPRIHAMAGLRPEDANDDKLKATYLSNIAYAANRAGTAGIDLLMEPINNYDIPGYFLNGFDTAVSYIEEVAKRGGTTPKLQFDIYHCQRIHGDVTQWIKRCAPHIAHYQIAGVPGRHEPDNGDLPFEKIVKAVEKFTPGLSIGCEYMPAGKTEDGLGWFEKYRNA